MDDRTPSPPAHDETEYWRQVLTGKDASLVKVQRVFRKLPSPPRCKLCRAPFSGPWTPFLRLVGVKRWKLNQQMCGLCIKRIEQHNGGADIPVSLLFVDIRGSTSLAEDMAPAE